MTIREAAELLVAALLGTPLPVRPKERWKSWGSRVSLAWRQEQTLKMLEAVKQQEKDNRQAQRQEIRRARRHKQERARAMLCDQREAV
jgi:hypothetical protein